MYTNLFNKKSLGVAFGALVTCKYLNLIRVSLTPKTDDLYYAYKKGMMPQNVTNEADMFSKNLTDTTTSVKVLNNELS